MIFKYNSPKIPFILLKTKLSPVTCHHMDNMTIPLKYFFYKCLRYFCVSPKSAVFAPESAVFPTYGLEVSKFFRIFVLAKKMFRQRRFCFQNDRSGCRIRPRLAPNCASWLIYHLETRNQKLETLTLYL